MFTHQKLVAFDVAMELAEQAEALSRVPVRYQSLGQQLFRAGRGGGCGGDAPSVPCGR